MLVTIVATALLSVGAVGQASANPRYAAYVIDANTGQVLFSRNADAKRYPASLTKMMTLYLVFEAMEAGRISKGTRLPVSAQAAAEPPSKIGIRAGSAITVENAILALVTKSANDVATAIGQHLGGSEQSFARMMTAKAKQLGMTGTQFRNAHGLPDPQQFTTARDMAILGIALREHFPQYYSYFSTRSFTYGKRRYGNHNRLLTRVRGVDGIKTGYIRASGFNLVSSVKDDGRSIVAVVMGGRTGRSRDDHMAELIREYLPKASRGRDGTLLAAQRPGAVVAGFALPQRNIPMPSFRPGGEVDLQAAAYVQAQTPPAVAAVNGLPSRVTPPASVPVPVAAPQASDERFAVDPVSTASIPASGWAVQISSSPSRGEAVASLVRTGKEASGILGDANAFVEEFDHKGTLYYRARFGFGSKQQAWNACDQLKRKKIDCYAEQL